MKVLKFVLIYSIIINFNSIEKSLAKEERKFYVVGNAGVIIDNSKLEQSMYDTIRDFVPKGLDVKNNIGFMSEWGLGYRVNNKIRFDVKIGLDKSDHVYLKDKVDNIYPSGLSEEAKKAMKATDHVYQKDAKIKAINFGLGINCYYDLPEVIHGGLGGLRPFVMAGAGVSKQEVATRAITSDYKVKYEKKNAGDSEYKKIQYDTNSNIYNKSYNIINPFYVLGLGVSMTNDNTPDYTIDFAYKFKNNLRQNFKDEGGNKVRIKSKAHNVTLGLRYHF